MSAPSVTSFSVTVNSRPSCFDRDAFFAAPEACLAACGAFFAFFATVGAGPAVGAVFSPKTQGVRACQSYGGLAKRLESLAATHTLTTNLDKHMQVDLSGCCAIDDMVCVL